MKVQQSIIHELEDAISHGSIEQRADTLRRVTDLFVSGAVWYSNEQIALFDDVIERLAHEIETSARAELAVRLAPIPNAPPNVIKKFAFDREVEVACPVLTQSERLDDGTLVEISKSMSEHHLLAISRRKALSEAVTDVLVERGNRDTVQSVVGNPGAKFSQPGYSVLVKRSESDDQIALSVGLRPDLPRHLFLQLLAKASETVRKKLEEEHHQRSRDIQNVIASAASRISSMASAMSRDYRAAEALIPKLHASSKLDESVLDGFAKAGKFENTTMSLALLCGLPIEIVERAMMQERPETMLFLAKAAGLQWRTVKSLLLLRSQGRGMSGHDLDQCLTNFHRLKRATAQQAIRLPRFAGSPKS